MLTMVCDLLNLVSFIFSQFIKSDPKDYFLDSSAKIQKN